MSALEDAWRSVPGVSAPHERTSFFDAGGTSLTAVLLLGRVERSVGAAVPMAAFLADPTLDGLASAIERHEAGPTRAPQLVTLRGGPAQAPLILVHPVTGSVLGYAGLAHALGDGRTVWAIEAGPCEPPPASLAELATRYLALVRARQPAGPYLLGGWSFGGIVAHEMACQLRDGGHAVGPLVVFDADTAMCGGPPPEVADARRLVEAAVGSSARAPPAPRQEMLETCLLHLELLADHAPCRLEGDLVLFEAARQPGEPAEPLLGWRPLIAGRIERIVVPGDHDSLLGASQVAALGALVTERLAA